MTNNRWTSDQLKLAFYLYCQLPFGKLHSRNPEIIYLASLIGRTPSALAMKLSNFASLDPAITSTGRKGLEGASNLDREIWNEFHADWEKLAVECEMLRRNLGDEIALEEETGELLVPEDYSGETRQVITEQRIKQNFFRRAVLSSYRGRCCMSGLSEARLLIASHIVPWSKDKANRLNPSNGLCLSAIHDRASVLKKLDEPFVNSVLIPLEGKLIEFPERFMPSLEFVSRHREDLFVDSKK
jgi:putative restriction endonuclease